MSEKMKAIRKPTAEPGLIVEDIPIPVPDSHDVLVRVEAASICGTDLHIWKWDEWSRNRIQPPLTLGHEFAGTVVEVGSAVEQVRVGDYVSAESHVTCGHCFQCRTGQAHMCPDTQILGVDREGAFAEYVSVPETVVWQNNRSKLPPDIASLQEPFGNAVFATLSHDLSGQTVAVFGCGPIGLFSIGIARASGAGAVFAIDPVDFRLNLAWAMGATKTFAPQKGESTVDWLLEANEGFGVDIVLEMSGAPAAINDAFTAVRNGGRMTLFGIPSGPVEIDVAEKMIFKNLNVFALNGRRIWDTWYKTRWLLESGVVDLRPLITRQMDFDQIDEAVGLLDTGQACKIVLNPGTINNLPQSDRSEDAADPNVRGQIVHP
ncbi:MAG: L-threonine 3-dehydrogenase [Candidatus Latescibacteria bacterium]|nr:L-threonine 3-dehydrogenase [Candidatus Latescibacterota bacterium]